MKPLHIFFDKQKVGTFLVDDALHMDFKYDENWLKQPNAFPLSLSLPLQTDIHVHPGPAIFLENLLPEQKIRRAIELAHKLSKDSPYQFLKEFGEDIAGAFVISDQEKASFQESSLISIPLETIQEAIDQGKQLYQSITDAYGTKFSLAGAQDKFCIVYKDEKIFVSLGSEPSTHIAKANLDFRNSQTVFNEYLCMNLAEKIGLPVPKVALIPKPALLIIERFDRHRIGEHIQRLHQEDFCQIQGIPSGQKYEDKGGPGLVHNYEVIRQNSTQPIKDLESFLDWISFNLIIGNNDSHSKNISILYQKNKVRLAPFYDLLSTTVYGSRFSQDFAFKIGSTARYEQIRKSDIRILESSIGVREGKFLKNLSRVTAEIEKHIVSVQMELKRMAPEETIGARIHAQIQQRLKHLRAHGGLDI